MLGRQAHVKPDRTVSDELTHSPDLQLTQKSSARDKYRVEKDGCDVLDLDEDLAEKFPFPEHPYNGAWPAIRRRDGSIVRP